MERAIRIDCDECLMQHTEVCEGCVVTYLCSRPAGAVVIDAAEARALRALGRGGLAPHLRHRPRTGTTGTAVP